MTDEKFWRAAARKADQLTDELIAETGSRAGLERELVRDSLYAAVAAGIDLRESDCASRGCMYCGEKRKIR